MSLIRAIGLVAVLAGLLLVGISGDNHRVPRVRNIVLGAGLMLIGAFVAMFARPITALLD